MRLLTLLPRLDGPPPSLPRLLDLASDRWWGLPPRRRLFVGGLTLCLLVAGVGLPRVLDDGPDLVEVLVAERDLPAGHEVEAADLQVQHRPADHAPDRPAQPPATGTLVSKLPRGAVLTEPHLRTGGLGTLVARGNVALALPAQVVAADARAGADIGVVTTDAPAGGPGLTAPTTVLRVDDDHVWIEVADTHAAGVARAAARGAVAVVVRPVSEEDDHGTGG